MKIRLAVGRAALVHIAKPAMTQTPRNIKEGGESILEFGGSITFRPLKRPKQLRIQRVTER